MFRMSLHDIRSHELLRCRTIPIYYKTHNLGQFRMDQQGLIEVRPGRDELPPSHQISLCWIEAVGELRLQSLPMRIY
jgi:hypothetical protein